MLRDTYGRRLPTRVLASTVTELAERVAAVQFQVSGAEEWNTRVWASVRNGSTRVQDRQADGGREIVA